VRTPAPLRRLGLLLGVACLFAAPSPARAQETGLAGYFPAEVGRTWTYELKLKANGKEKVIQYTTRAEKLEEVEGVGECVLFVSSSADRLLQRAWFKVGEDRIENPRQQGSQAAAPVVAYEGRVVLTADALKPSADPEAKPPEWSWTASDGSAGSIVLARRGERLYLPRVGDLKECLALIETGTYHMGVGEERKVSHTTERTVWLAPGLGMVKETLTIRLPDGTVTFQTEATLTKFQGP
jgi:hypothetical protein